MAGNNGYQTAAEATILGTLALLSSLLPVQSFLIDQRQSVQASYQAATAQTIHNTPPILLVQVDEATLRNVEVINQNLDRKYLAKLVNRTTELHLPTVGLDYLLFRPQPSGDPVLAASPENSRRKKAQNSFWQRLPKRLANPPNWVRVLPEIASPQQPWRVDGDIDLLGDPPFYARTIGDTKARTQVLPMAYALVQQIAGFHEDTRSRIHPVSQFAAAIGQMWLRPLIDFSIPPDRVYQSIPAGQFLQQQAIAAQPIVLIAAGGQIDAGVTPGEDNFNSPAAFQHWQNRSTITGGEVHAYLVHNLIHQRLIMPIPDLWLIGLAGLLGKGSALWLARNQSRRARWLLGIPVLYTAASLQTYVWYAVLFPIMFPIVTYLAYIIHLTWKRDRYA